MRYLVKVYTLTDEEEGQVTLAVQAGLLQDAERLSGFTQGTADAKGIQGLVARGLNALSVEEIAGSDMVSRVGGAVKGFAAKALAPLGIQPFGVSAGADFEIERADGRQNYLLGRIAGALTPGRLKRLGDAGVHIVEKREGDTYVIRAESAATLNALDFVKDVRTYDVGQTLVGAPEDSALPRQLQEFEAVVHADVDAAQVAEAIAGMGGAVTSSDERSVRFPWPART